MTPPAALRSHHWPTVVLTIAIGTLGGIAAKFAHLPLPMLLGALLAVAAVALIGWKPLGRPVQFPVRLRFWFIPILGVAIGASFTPAILDEVQLWWPSLVALCVFIPLAHFLSFSAVRAMGGLDPVTALFGTAPGGLIETVQMAEERGGDGAMVTVLQFIRVIVTIISVPLFFTWLTGHAVGSAGGATLDRAAFTLADLPWLVAAAVIGAGVGRIIRLPAGFMTGPILCSGLFHLLGYVESAPPALLVQATQLIIGVSLGVRFAGIERHRLRAAALMATVSTAISLALAAVMAFALAPLIDEPRTAVFLAFAPGGLAEMSLIALSMQMSIVYVTAHHAMRIVLAVLAAKFLAKRTL
ncbi:AbrB family transcriptional regulator [Pseudothioclava arenosa]|uniref:Aminopeptidase n=1 Tax=Pseudothioclava arenosa TaxID=1795308 RepID=A0A2A4CU22_9RHOB|nr:AbrB family transcriptional regulator [Pseudothioclava arenosa]PCD78075.1 aminopeptidase [Pseudothioclava arenosa]